MNSPTPTFLLQREHKGLSLDILRPVRHLREGIDTSNQGLSAYFESVTLVGIAGAGRGRPSLTPLQPTSQVFAPSDRSPAVVLRVNGSYHLNAHLIPISFDDSGRAIVPEGHLSHGGAYATSSDSRVSEILAAVLGHHFYGAIAVHDRFEF